MPNLKSLAHPGWLAIVFPLALTIASTFSPDTLRELLLLVAVVTATWIFHKTEFAHGDYKITFVAGVAFVVTATVVFGIGQAIDTRKVASTKLESPAVSEAPNAPHTSPKISVHYKFYPQTNNHHDGVLLVSNDGPTVAKFAAECEIQHFANTTDSKPKTFEGSKFVMVWRTDPTNEWTQIEPGKTPAELEVANIGKVDGDYGALEIWRLDHFRSGSIPMNFITEHWDQGPFGTKPELFLKISIFQKEPDLADPWIGLYRVRIESGKDYEIEVNRED